MINFGWSEFDPLIDLPVSAAHPKFNSLVARHQFCPCRNLFSFMPKPMMALLSRLLWPSASDLLIFEPKESVTIFMQKHFRKCIVPRILSTLH